MWLTNRISARFTVPNLWKYLIRVSVRKQHWNSKTLSSPIYYSHHNQTPQPPPLPTVQCNRDTNNWVALSAPYLPTPAILLSPCTARYRPQTVALILIGAHQGYWPGPWIPQYAVSQREMVKLLYRFGVLAVASAGAIYYADVLNNPWCSSFRIVRSGRAAWAVSQS